MKTAEVAIEHVLVGLLALCAFILPFLSELSINWESLPSETLLGVGVLGLAYLFGIIFDKLADTVLSPIEQWLRLGQADRNLKDDKACYDGDPFPQDVLEFSLRGDQEGRLEWMGSLRSRIRTSRGLAVLGLPAAMAIAVFQSLMNDSSMGWQWLPYSAVATNLFFMAGSIWISSRKTYKLPKTSKLCKDKVKRTNQMKRAKEKMLIGISLYVLMLINSAATLSIIAASRVQHFESVVIGISGVLATLAALWTWSSITKTYMAFVYQKLPELLSEKG